MNNKIIGMIMFAVGAAVGSAVTWKFVKTKYEMIADEEIKSVKEVYLKKERRLAEKAKEQRVKDKPDLSEYSKKLKEEGYIDERNENDMSDDPYVIPPDEFGNSEYDAVSLTYYSDGVLTDDWDKIIENIDDIVGADSLYHFGEYEDDSVFVRNDRLKTDYEILLDERKYSDLYGSSPHEEE